MSQANTDEYKSSEDTTIADTQKQTTKKSKKNHGPRRRTKTGCMTCRTRRIKCDEAKPVCKNCTKSRRECAGYQPPSPSQEPSPTSFSQSPTRPSPLESPPGSLDGMYPYRDQMYMPQPQLMPQNQMPLDMSMQHMLPVSPQHPPYAPPMMTWPQQPISSPSAQQQYWTQSPAVYMPYQPPSQPQSQPPPQSHFQPQSQLRPQPQPQPQTQTFWTNDPNHQFAPTIHQPVPSQNKDRPPIFMRYNPT